MRLVIMGPPGAGKGTQAQKIAHHFSVPHISTGDLFRENIASGTPLGVEAEGYMARGELVPPELTNEMVRVRLAAPDADNGFVLDGFPRSVAQAQALAEMLSQLGVKLNAVLSFDVPEDVVVQRMLSRGRPDDVESVIRRRLSVYREETAPVLGYYAGNVSHIDAEGEIDQVFGRVLAAIDAV